MARVCSANWAADARLSALMADRLCAAPLDVLDRYGQCVTADVNNRNLFVHGPGNDLQFWALSPYEWNLWKCNCFESGCASPKQGKMDSGGFVLIEYARDER
jgi:hypothetical protein